MLKFKHLTLTKNSQTKTLNRQNGYISPTLCPLTQQNLITEKCFQNVLQFLRTNETQKNCF